MKSIFSSKTFWLAIAQAIIGGVVAIDTTHPAVGLLLIGKSVIDVVVRYMTTQRVTVQA